MRIEKRIEWRESSTNEPVPMTLDTRHEVGEHPASALVIDSTVANPALIANIGGGQEVEVSWGLIDDTQEACQSQPGTVQDGDTASWNTVHFNTDEAHELRVTYEEGPGYHRCRTDGVHRIRTPRIGASVMVIQQHPVVAHGGSDECHLVDVGRVVEQFDGLPEIAALPNSVQDIHTGMAVVKAAVIVGGHPQLIGVPDFENFSSASC